MQPGGQTLRISFPLLDPIRDLYFNGLKFKNKTVNDTPELVQFVIEVRSQTNRNFIPTITEWNFLITLNVISLVQSYFILLGIFRESPHRLCIHNNTNKQ